MPYEKIKTIKVALLFELNRKPYKDITDNEAELIFCLSQDPDIQECLSKGKKDE